ncbi:DUF2971 domain-containing protein [Vibrio sp. T187]|nr:MULTISPECIES: DUF2971 domain-containing protein [Vibrio]MBW3697020.1 DUF2971 domain-containing protein [Vibrio sp. T187]
MIPKLYKFRSINDRNVHAITESALWFNCPKAFNDPFESSFLVDTDNKKTSEQSLQLACFSKSYSHPLLWSRYADNYRGMCIEYDFSQFSKCTDLSFFEINYCSNSYLNDSYNTKHISLAYEQEFRCGVADNALINNKLLLNRECITAVILSELAPADRALKVVMACSELGIPVKKAICERQTYTFQIKELD